MVTGTRQKQLGLDGIHGNTLVASSRPTAGHGGGRHGDKGLIVGGRWKIQGDGLQIVVYRRTKSRWVEEAYVSTLSSALSWLVNQTVRSADLADLAATVKRIEELRNQIIGIAAGGGN